MHFIRVVIAAGNVMIIKNDTTGNPTDMLVKVIPVSKFKLCLDLLKMDEG